MANVALNGIQKSYGKLQVIESIDLEIDDGEFVVLLGPSGCGKSTTLRMVAGLEEISGGIMRIGDTIVNELAPKDRKIAMVFQNYALYPHMTVAQNMGFGLRLQRMPKPEIAEKVGQAAKILELEPLLNRKPSELSGGQRQRVAMGRAMVRQPEVFLFDEPLSNLDAKLRTQMRFEIQKLHHHLNTTTIYVTHDQIEAMTLADRIVIMRDGNIEQIGAPKKVFDNPANIFVASFIGSPAMNLIPMRTVSDGDGIGLLSGSLRFPLPGKENHSVQMNSDVVVGIRPTSIELATEENDPFTFSANVEETELLGAEAILKLKLGEHDILAQVDGRSIPSRGDNVRILFDKDALHVFDAATEQSVY